MEISPAQATLLAALLGALVLLCVHTRNAYRTASAKFRSTILGELKSVYPLPAQWPQDIDAFLRRAFPQLQAAVAEFRAVVPIWRRRRFDQAWMTYRNTYGREQDNQVYHHYIGFDDMPDPKEAFRQNVERLLSYAHAT